MRVVFPRFYHKLESIYKELFQPISDTHSVVRVNHAFVVSLGIGADGPFLVGNPGDYLVCMDKKLISVWRQEEIECLS